MPLAPLPPRALLQLIVAAALFLASKAMDGPRPVMHVAHAYFKVKNANKPEELAALARDPVCGGGMVLLSPSPA